jgi:hypothetical protein
MLKAAGRAGGVSQIGNGRGRQLRRPSGNLVAHSERFELPTLGIEIRCSIQLSYECL